MQDRYAGDVGDFVKLGLLRALSSGRRLGVAWYRYPDESHNGDGRHITYLDQPQRYEHLDPVLFSHLRNITRDARSINSLLPVLEDAVSSDESVDSSMVAPRERRNWRTAWFQRVMERLSTCDLVFADPIMVSSMTPIGEGGGRSSASRCPSQRCRSWPKVDAL